MARPGRPLALAALALGAGAAGLLLAAPAPAAAHGFLEKPRPRNLFASEEGRWWVPASEDSSQVPYPEDCPHCMNRYENAKFPGGNYCGITQDGQRGYNRMLSYSGDVIAQPPVQATLDEGGDVDIKFRLTAHHKGHVELGACCKDPATTSDTQMQKCFNKNKLTFVKDKLYGANRHPEYPERG